MLPGRRPIGLVGSFPSAGGDGLTPRSASPPPEPLAPTSPPIGRPATLEEVVIGHMAAGRVRRRGRSGRGGRVMAAADRDPPDLPDQPLRGPGHPRRHRPVGRRLGDRDRLDPQQRIRRLHRVRRGRPRSPASSSRMSGGGRPGSRRCPRRWPGSSRSSPDCCSARPLIARELDKGTARLAWSLGPSRRRWYLPARPPDPRRGRRHGDDDRHRGGAADRAVRAGRRPRQLVRRLPHARGARGHERAPGREHRRGRRLDRRPPDPDGAACAPPRRDDAARDRRGRQADARRRGGPPDGREPVRQRHRDGRGPASSCPMGGW